VAKTRSFAVGEPTQDLEAANAGLFTAVRLLIEVDLRCRSELDLLVGSTTIVRECLELSQEW